MDILRPDHQYKSRRLEEKKFKFIMKNRHGVTNLMLLWYSKIFNVTAN